MQKQRIYIVTILIILKSINISENPVGQTIYYLVLIKNISTPKRDDRANSGSYLGDTDYKYNRLVE